MSTLNAILRAVFDALLYPFRDLPAWVGLVVVSLATAAFMLVVFKRTSDQVKLAAVKRQIHACLFEIRLFNHDLRAILRAQVEILGHNARYLGLSFVPMLWMIVPLTLVIAQLQFHYGYAPLALGDRALVKVALADGAAAAGTTKPALRLTAAGGVRVETPGVWIPSKREMTFRVAAEAEGEHELRVELDGQTHAKSVRIGGGVVRRSPLRHDGRFLDAVLYPAEDPLPKGGAIRGIEVGYRDGEVGLLWWDAHWMIAYFALSLVFAFLLRKRFGVTI